MILRSIQNVQFNNEGKVIEDTISGPLRAFSRRIHISQLQEPFLSDEIVANYQNLVQKEIFFEQTNIETKDEFDAIYHHYKNIRGNHLFRGMNEAKYRILSSIQRQWLWQKLGDTGKTSKDLVEIIIEKAKSDEILKKHFETIGVDIDNEISILSFLQHYGCPTPLIDWTFNFDNALFFALSEIKPPQEQRRIDNYISVYLIEERHIIEGSLKELIRTSLQSLSNITKPAMVKRAKELGIDENYANQALTDKAVERVALASYAQRFLEERLLSLDYFYTHPFLYFSDLDNFNYNISFALRNNQNVINQKGVFMWNNSPNFPVEQVGRNEALAVNPDANYRFCKCLNINKKLESHISKKLESNGVTENFIYPKKNKKEFEELAKKTFDEAVKELKK